MNRMRRNKRRATKGGEECCGEEREDEEKEEGEPMDVDGEETPEGTTGEKEAMEVDSEGIEEPLPRILPYWRPTDLGKQAKLRCSKMEQNAAVEEKNGEKKKKEKPAKAEEGAVHYCIEPTEASKGRFSQAQAKVKKAAKKKKNRKFKPSFIRLGKFEMGLWCDAPYPSYFKKFDVVLFCDFCLKMFVTEAALKRHMERKKSAFRHPPGREVYRCDHYQISVFEVDGAIEEAFCANLALIARSYIGHKTVVDNNLNHFIFYVLTHNDYATGFHFAGYFCKERLHEVGCARNVGDIVTLPCYQNKGYGRFLIEFSYLIMRKIGLTGAPERPFSDSARIMMSSYWRTTLMEYLFRKGREGCTVPQIATATGMSSSDVAKTFRAFGWIKKKKGGGFQVVPEWDCVKEQFREILTNQKRIWLKEEHVAPQWTPLYELPPDEAKIEDGEEIDEDGEEEAPPKYFPLPTEGCTLENSVTGKNPKKDKAPKKEKKKSGKGQSHNDSLSNESEVSEDERSPCPPPKSSSRPEVTSDVESWDRDLGFDPETLVVTRMETPTAVETPKTAERRTIAQKEGDTVTKKKGAGPRAQHHNEHRRPPYAPQSPSAGSEPTAPIASSTASSSSPLEESPKRDSKGGIVQRVLRFLVPPPLPSKRTPDSIKSLAISAGKAKIADRMDTPQTTDSLKTAERSTIAQKSTGYSPKAQLHQEPHHRSPYAPQSPSAGDLPISEPTAPIASTTASSSSPLEDTPKSGANRGTVQKVHLLSPPPLRQRRTPHRSDLSESPAGGATKEEAKVTPSHTPNEIRDNGSIAPQELPDCSAFYPHSPPSGDIPSYEPCAPTPSSAGHSSC